MPLRRTVRITNIRANALHKLTTHLTKNHAEPPGGRIVIEDRAGGPVEGVGHDQKTISWQRPFWMVAFSSSGGN